MKFLIWFWFLSPWIEDAPTLKRPVTISKWYYKKECGLWVRFATSRNGRLIKHQWSMIPPQKRYRASKLK